MAEVMAEPGNPSSIHAWGRRARGRLEAARRTIAAAVGTEPAGVTFTSGGTEANALALAQAEGPVLVSAIEHSSVLEAMPDAVRVPVHGDGTLRLDALNDLLRMHRPALVSLMLANNETGVVQPVAEAADLVHAYGARLHIDAVQALGKLPLSLPALGADFLTFSAHKLGGPPGVGALLTAPGIDLKPVQRGGGQEHRHRAGTENLPGIVGFARAVELLDLTVMDRIARWRDRLEAGLRAVCPDLVVAGAGARRLPNTSCLLPPGISAETQLMALDLEGIAVSSGAACSSGKVDPSHVLAAMGFPPDLARCAIRVSLGWTSTEADIERFVETWTGLYQHWRRRHAEPA